MRLGGPNLRAAGGTLRHETVQRAAMGLAAPGRWAESAGCSLDTRILPQHAARSADMRRFLDDERSVRSVGTRSGCAGAVLHRPTSLGEPARPCKEELRQWVNKLACIHLFEEEYFRRRGSMPNSLGIRCSIDWLARRYIAAAAA